MKIYYYGHACFKLDTRQGSIVLDPYEPGSVFGLELPELTADAVLCSHGHHDHSYAGGVKLSGRQPDMRISTFDCFHDNSGGVLRGENRIALIEAEGLRLAHLGDLGHMLSREQLEALGRIDVLLLPVGGFYTIDAETAFKLAAALKPRIVIPMHYRAAEWGLKNIAPVENYLSLAGGTVFAGGSVFDPEELTSPATVVMKPAALRI